MLDVIQSFSSVGELIQQVFEILLSFITFLFNFIISIPSYFSSLLDFLKVYVIELPITLLSIFVELPTFVQTGLMVVIYAMYIAFALKILKMLLLS